MKIQYYFAVLVCLTLNCSCIVDKLALFPTRESAYADSSAVKEVVITTKDKKEIWCLYLYSEANDKIALYFHGNGENIYQSQFVLNKIFNCGVNVFGVDFRGYGKSSGKSSEKGIYKDGEAALSYVKEKLKYSGKNIIIIGRSIGTAVACNTAQNSDISKLILMTPISNGYEYAKCHGLGILSIIAKNKYDNLSKLRNINCNLLVIGAVKDEILPVFMSHEIVNSYKGKVEFKTIDNAFHNDILYTDSTYKYTCDFINK